MLSQDNADSAVCQRRVIETSLEREPPRSQHSPNASPQSRLGKDDELQTSDRRGLALVYAAIINL